MLTARIDELTEKADKKRKGEPFRSVEVYYDELFDMSQALHTSIRHIEELITVRRDGDKD